jgi:hypothetical protein
MATSVVATPTGGKRVAIDDDGFRVGWRGGSLGETSDALGWAVGKLEHENEATLRRGISHGNDSPNTLQLIVLYIATGFFVVLLLAHEVVPARLTDEVWPLAAVWFAGSTLLYFVLKLLPSLLSGILMGAALGLEAGYTAQLYIQWHWAIVIGLGTAALMYLLYSSLR